MEEFKKCSKCKEIKAKSCFAKATRLKSGVSSQCKDCIAENRVRDKEKIRSQQRKWYDDNIKHVQAKDKIRRQTHKEVLSQKDAEKYKRNRDKILKYVAQYQKDNPEVGRLAGKKYREANPDKQTAKTAKRRAAKLRATLRWLIDDELEQFLISEIYHLASIRSTVTGVLYNVDHIVPLQSKFVCGLHVSWNLQIIDSISNIKKHNRHWPDMW